MSKNLLKFQQRNPTTEIFTFQAKETYLAENTSLPSYITNLEKGNIVYFLVDQQLYINHMLMILFHGGGFLRNTNLEKGNICSCGSTVKYINKMMICSMEVDFKEMQKLSF